MNRADATYLTKALPLGDAPAGGTFRVPGGRLALSVGGYVAKALDRRKGSVQSVLSFPGRDYDGDTINPAGGDWAREFPRNPVVNWTHDVPIGRGSVPELKAFDVGGETLRLPVGTTHFFQSKADTRGLRLLGRDASGAVVREYTAGECLHAAESAARLVFDGIADGVSVEFVPDGPQGKAFWPTGQESTLLRRPEMHWEKWVGKGWAHALQVKNPNAAVIQDSVDKAFRVAETGRIGGHTVSPLVMKAFLPLRDRKPKFVRVERKAMDTDDEFPDDPTQDTAADAADTGDMAGAGGAMKPTPKLIMTALQHFKDGTALIREAVGGDTVEHEGGIDILMSYADKFDALLGKMNAEAAKEFPEAGFEPVGSDGPPEGDDLPVETDDDGAVTNKAFPDGFPVRFRLAKHGGYEQIRPTETAPADAVRMKAVADRIEANERQLRKERREAEREARIKARNDARIHSDY